MAKPIVAIVGRPNVGKSTLFNYIAGKRISIVNDTPGITRDRIYADTEWRNRSFTIIDTGGIEPDSSEDILKKMRMQAEIAINTADVIVFMVDYRAGLTAADNEVAHILRKAVKPVIVAVNKVDKIGETPPGAYEFYNLGMENLVMISSTNALGIGDLLDEIFSFFPEKDIENEDEKVTRVAVIGKPNTGKSSLVNKVLKEERVIVSNVPGTTRDAVDTYVEKNGKGYIFIDTAGLRKKNKIREDIEHYSAVRSWAAVDRADVCLIMIDAVDGATEQDTKIGGYAHEQGKASILVVNKWDLVEKDTGTLEKYRREILEKFSFMSYAPVVFISAKTGQRVDALFETIDNVDKQSRNRITTGLLNDTINEATAIAQPPSDKGKRLKILYITQVSVKPPTFAVFVNNADLMHFSYTRYLENTLRQSFGFEGTPIRILIREKGVQKEMEGV